MESVNRVLVNVSVHLPLLGKKRCSSGPFNRHDDSRLSRAIAESEQSEEGDFEENNFCEKDVTRPSAWVARRESFMRTELLVGEGMTKPFFREIDTYNNFSILWRRDDLHNQQPKPSSGRGASWCHEYSYRPPGPWPEMMSRLVWRSNC